MLDFEAYQPSLSVSAGVYRRESELWVQGEWPSLPAADVPLVASETFTDTACLLLTVRFHPKQEALFHTSHSLTHSDQRCVLFAFAFYD